MSGRNKKGTQFGACLTGRWLNHREISLESLFPVLKSERLKANIFIIQRVKGGKKWISGFYLLPLKEKSLPIY